MSVSFNAALADVVVASGAAVSRSVRSADEYSDATAVCIISPAALTAATYTIEVSFDGTTFVTLNDGAADIGPPAAGKGRQYVELIGFNFWRIKQSSNAAADITFKVTKQWTA
jgi:hypothetical protein